MMRQKIVAGNWKMNTTLEDAERLIKTILKTLTPNGSVQKIVFPPFPFLTSVSHLLKGSDSIFMGAQNCSEHSQGAYTGEVSAAMLQSAGCQYVLVGHSERRMYFKESDEQLLSKIRQALTHDLKVIFCFGEHLSERNSHLHFETVNHQLQTVLKHLTESEMEKVVLAYEPVWAIGTGETATPMQAQKMHAFVRSCLGTLFSENVSQGLTILYGGSCNTQNARELFACPDVDGGLIGGASLKGEDFCKIADSFS